MPHFIAKKVVEMGGADFSAGWDFGADSRASLDFGAESSASLDFRAGFDSTLADSYAEAKSGASLDFGASLDSGERAESLFRHCEEAEPTKQSIAFAESIDSIKNERRELFQESIESAQDAESKSSKNADSAIIQPANGLPRSSYAFARNDETPDSGANLDSSLAESSILHSRALKLQSLKTPSLSLISIPYIQENTAKICLIQEIQRKNDVLVRGLKIARPTPIGILKDILRKLSKNYEVITDNLAQNSIKQDVKSPFLLDFSALMQVLENVDSSAQNKVDSRTENQAESKSNDLQRAESKSQKFQKLDSSVQNKAESRDLQNADSSAESKSQISQKIDSSVHLEIGFGSGRHILALAQSRPESIIIGLEIHTPSIEQVLRQIELLGLKNLFVLCMDARVLVEILPRGSLERIYIHFPVPWNDSPSKRVFSARFLTHAINALKQNGEVEFRTDDEKYFDDVLQIAQKAESNIKSSLESNAKSNIKSSLDSSADKATSADSSAFQSTPQNTLIKVTHAKNIDKSVISKYEARWRRQSKDIFDIHIKKLAKSATKAPIDDNTQNPPRHTNTQTNMQESAQMGAQIDTQMSAQISRAKQAIKYEFKFDEKLIQSLFVNAFCQSGQNESKNGTKNGEPEIIQKLCQKQLFDDGFLHIYDVYQDSEARVVMLLVSMGDFICPCNRVVVLESMRESTQEVAQDKTAPNNAEQEKIAQKQSKQAESRQLESKQPESKSRGFGFCESDESDESDKSQKSRQKSYFGFYLPQAPLPTLANQKAHSALIKLLEQI
ncbi:tRNA (guanosine(46)-N7)-methyltransferase TrmB [Helicobacter sp. CLO-3]|uniref:tRNA (guanosine(46)-N7)-methyltransferase TrmB n=1 Tax=unclassified Helicobacter TaxID=2593540 RepID=UPI000806078A|nr:MULTISPECIES: tRNA (guanosine(46)-N7)-methyltransferase TrmB [unclassified Helicobacter]OBV28887.1 tRNA (guanosine(46)-N7)-methyltransferase TrmB [Helicobacter sp. CLO-3]OHU85587.1 tRNA (guanosine(46)-N7)-methyltransferase TrmB [Helicobacter sp. CLO-3]